MADQRTSSKGRKFTEIQPLWRPSKESIKNSNLSLFVRHLYQQDKSLNLENFEDLHNWSINHPQKFWRAVWGFTNVIPSKFKGKVFTNSKNMINTKWFPETKLNFAENLLQYRDESDALIFLSEKGIRWKLSWEDLYNSVSRAKQALENAGLKQGDCVVAYMPNCPDTVVFMLATTSIGAIWSSCSPDFGTKAILDRFGQLDPKMMIATEGYYYNGDRHDVMPRVREITSKLPSLKKIIVSCLTTDNPKIDHISGAILTYDFVKPYKPQKIIFQKFPFNHPLYVLFSSGTTGKPKCIVHGAGGTLIQHLKEHKLHIDLKKGDRLFYFTTCGWMMWNWTISALATGTTVLLFDGSPFYPNPRRLFEYIENEDITVFGTSAKYIDSLKNMKEKPNRQFKLKSLKTILSTGSPLSPESFRYVYGQIKSNVLLCSISGGTDIISCFVLGNPNLPVYPGEIQSSGLGMAVKVMDEQGNFLSNQKGELTCIRPFPSMPIYFWNDQQRLKYKNSYFRKYQNVWHHGDLIEFTPRGGYIIHGRSDTVLNPGGVRIGTAEIYRQVEDIAQVSEAIAVGQKIQLDTRIILFVKLNEEIKLTENLINLIKARIKNNTSPRHVPAKILAVQDIPRTKSGKIVEKTVEKIINGIEETNIDSLANPESLIYFKNRPELAT